MKQVIVDAKESSFGGMEAAVSRLEGGESWEGRYIYNLYTNFLKYS